MKSSKVIKPDFLLIGAQRSGTTWFWDMLKQHPETDLHLEDREPHFFGSSEIYSKGKDWYYSKFDHLDSSKVVGEGSTSYFYDHVPYFHNPTSALKHDYSLPTIPELITNELPDIKVFINLRDPVKRAVSAYSKNARSGRIPPFTGLKEIAERLPKMRILEYGYYARYIKLWKKFVPRERMSVFVFEQDIVGSPEETIKNAYRFLGMDEEFKPEDLRMPRNKSWGWTRILLQYYAGSSIRKRSHKRIISWFFDRLDRLDLLKRFTIQEKDIEFLRSVYLPEKDELEDLIERNLDCWSYHL